MGHTALSFDGRRFVQMVRGALGLFWYISGLC